MPFIENQGAKIYWDERSVGDPVLLITGLGYPSDMWWRTRPVLDGRYRTIVLDNRGAAPARMRNSRTNHRRSRLALDQVPWAITVLAVVLLNLTDRENALTKMD